MRSEQMSKTNNLKKVEKGEPGETFIRLAKRTF